MPTPIHIVAHATKSTVVIIPASINFSPELFYFIIYKIQFVRNKTIPAEAATSIFLLPQKSRSSVPVSVFLLFSVFFYFFNSVPTLNFYFKLLFQTLIPNSYFNSPAGCIISGVISPLIIRYCSMVFTQFCTPTRSLFNVMS